MNCEAVTRLLRQPKRCLSWYLLALAACTPSAKPGAEQDLDLGGGISMAPAGEIRGATKAWTPGLPSFDWELPNPLGTPGLHTAHADEDLHVP